jgi:hypothetical protein
MELKTYERLILLNALPREGDITTLKIIRKLREDLSFSEAEHKALNITDKNPQTGDVDGLVYWNHEADIPKDVQIGEKAMDIIKNTFEMLNKQKKLREEHLDIYERFIGGNNG